MQRNQQGPPRQPGAVGPEDVMSPHPEGPDIVPREQKASPPADGPGDVMSPHPVSLGGQQGSPPPDDPGDVMSSHPGGPDVAPGQQQHSRLPDSAEGTIEHQP